MRTRFTLALAVALTLSAAPLVAQTSTSANIAEAATAQAEPPRATASDARLEVSPEQIRATLKTTESRDPGVGSRSWLYLVAAIAVAIIIAAVILN